jgi:hypothetical protein
VGFKGLSRAEGLNVLGAACSGRYLCAARARSSVVELWFYTPAVGGSIPSAPTNVYAGRCHTATQLVSTEEPPLCQECANWVRAHARYGRGSLSPADLGCQLAAGLSAINRGFNKVPKRAEGRVSAQLRDTFVDSGVATALESIDNQILYGRRGTGKTHAFSYLAATRGEEGGIGIYVDLRTVGLRRMSI